MRRGIFLLFALLASLVAIPPAQAGSIDANKFAQDDAYCGTGSLTIDKTLVVQGGNASFKAGSGCQITLADKAQLKLINVELSTTGSFGVTGGAGSKVNVKQSTLDVGGPITLEPGCCGTGLDGARLQVIGSTIESGSNVVYLDASLYAAKGRVQVNASTIQSVPSGSGGILAYASTHVDTGAGKVLVTGSTLDAGTGNVEALTAGDKSSIQIKKNTLTFGYVSIRAQGGKCKTQDNTPVVSCS
jgi:hypothetical protein